MRKYRSFLSPDDALRDLRKHASQGAEIRWELHTSRTDVDLASRARCSCHSLTPQASSREHEKRHPERGDLRKHHSAETDKWSLKPDTEHDLRKHLSDLDSLVDRERGWTLQVPELHANPKQRCTCPRPPPAALSASASPSDEERRASRRASPRVSDSEEVERKTSLRSPRSLTPEDAVAVAVGLLQKRPSADSRSSRERGSTSPLPQQPIPTATTGAKMSKKERKRAQASEAKRELRSRWAVRPHFSLPAEKKESVKWLKSLEDGKSKSLKERPKYSVRRSMSPDPDPRQMQRLDNRLVRRLISPDIAILDAPKWAPYEGYSPLPTIGIKKRETKKISDIKWQPYDESPIQATGPDVALIEEPPPPEDDRPWSPFHNITPPHLPPPAATPMRDQEDDFRMRFLNQVSAFPIYQGAWREESPPASPPPADLSTPVWSPQEPQMLQLRKQSSQMIMRPSPSPPPSPPPVQKEKRSTLKVRSSRKKAARAKSQESTRVDERQQQQQQQQLPQAPALKSIMRASSEESRKRRPQLMRSRALLDVPHIDASKRSLSEEVRSYTRTESTKRGLIFRAKSEDAARLGQAWFDDEDERQELREYVTTV